MLSNQSDPQIPGKSRLQEAVLAFVSGTLSIGIMGAIAHAVHGAFIFPSLGPTAILLFYRPEAGASSPRNTILGHLIGTLCGFVALAIFGLLDGPNAFEAGVSASRVAAAALSLGATASLMIAFRTVHPPAGATTLIVALGLMTRPDQLLILMIAVALLVLQALVTHRIVGTAYPLWSPK